MDPRPDTRPDDELPRRRRDDAARGRRRDDASGRPEPSFPPAPDIPLRSRIVRRNNVSVRGDGRPAIVFGHGFGCGRQMWRHVAPAFEATHRVVTFDYVGAGRSDAAAYDFRRYGSLHGYAQDVLEVCESLELEDAVFVGHSVSGMIGLLAAIREPRRFSSMVMLAPSPRYVNAPGYHGGFERGELLHLLELMDANDMGWAGTLARTVMKHPDRPALAEELRESFCATPPAFIRQFAEVAFLSDHRDDLPHCRVPVLVAQCRDDAIAPDSVGDYLLAHLPQASLVHLATAGHCPQLSAPDETIAVIRDWLATAPVRPAAAATVQS